MDLYRHKNFRSLCKADTTQSLGRSFEYWYPNTEGMAMGKERQDNYTRKSDNYDDK